MGNCSIRQKSDSIDIPKQPISEIMVRKQVSNIPRASDSVLSSPLMTLTKTDLKLLESFTPRKMTYEELVEKRPKLSIIASSIEETSVSKDVVSISNMTSQQQNDWIMEVLSSWNTEQPAPTVNDQLELVLSNNSYIILDAKASDIEISAIVSRDQKTFKSRTSMLIRNNQKKQDYIINEEETQEKVIAAMLTTNNPDIIKSMTTISE
jgi:hypothetical protein